MRNRALAKLAVTALLGCGRESLPVTGTAVEEFDRTFMVTPSVSKLLDSDGRIPSQEASIDGAITSSKAAQLAEAYIRLFGPHSRTWIEGLHGGPVDFKQLRADQQVLLSEGPFEVLDATAFAPDRKRAGPYYLVALHDEDRPVVTVAVSAFSSDLTIDSGGVHTTAPVRGNDFLVWPVQRNSSAMPALSPEQAIVVAYRAFGQPIDAIPSYERKGLEFLPQEGAWRLILADSVDVLPVKGGTLRRTRVLYVVDGSTFAIGSTEGGETVPNVRSLDGARSLSYVPLRYRETAARTLVEVRAVTNR